jgi:GTP cyclohydrolase II
MKNSICYWKPIQIIIAKVWAGITSASASWQWLNCRHASAISISLHSKIIAMEHVAITKGDVIGASDVPVRLHSECLTGDALGSLRCDCRDQLETALRKIGQMDRGMLLYLRQEGRGIGLINKIRAYSLQDEGLDTVEANLALGFRDDERDYAVAAHMLMSLKIKSVQLMTNNPKKINQLTQYGIDVNGRIPHIMAPNEYNRFYLETKAVKSGHMIDFHGKGHLPEQYDDPIVEGMSEDQIGAINEQ